MSKKYYNLRCQAPEKLHKDITNIAKNKGMYLQDYLRYALRIAVDNTDEKLKKDYVE